MSGVTVQVNGLAQLQRSLRELGENIEAKVIRSALSSTAATVRNAARANFLADWNPESKTISNNIVLRRARTSRKSLTRYTVGVRAGRFAKPTPQKQRGPRGGLVYVNDPFYWRFLEFGFTDRGGEYHQGSRFLRRSLSDNRDKALSQFTKIGARNLEKYTRQLRGSAAAARSR